MGWSKMGMALRARSQCLGVQPFVFLTFVCKLHVPFVSVIVSCALPLNISPCAIMLCIL